MAESKYFGRYYNLRLSLGRDTIAEYYTESGKPAMDIRFDVTFCRDYHCRQGNISILGLKWETIHQFLELSAMPKGTALSKRLRVELQAGYFSSAGWTEIFSGYAHYATVTAPPQMWLNLSVAEFSPSTGAKCANNIPPTQTLAAVAKKVMDDYSRVEGVEFDFEDCTEDSLCSEKKSFSFDYNGTLGSTIEKMSRDLDNRVTFILKGSKLHAYDKLPEKAAKGTITVDNENGLLSVSGIDAVNGDVTTFLSAQNPNLTFMDLTSQLNPQANGRYQIVKKQFIGHYAGPEWYVRYHCTARSKDA